jgi:hypothetical protein
MIGYGNELVRTSATTDVLWAAGEGTTRAYSPDNLFSRGTGLKTSIVQVTLPPSQYYSHEMSTSMQPASFREPDKLLTLWNIEIC